MSTIGLEAVPPTVESVKARIKEFDKIGRESFLKKYAAGFGARSYFVLFEDGVYDLKAVFAASHTPPISCQKFNSVEAMYRMRSLGFSVAADEEAKRFIEGKKRYRETSYFSRNPALVQAAKAAHGVACMVCEFDFEAKYGDIGHGFIECHHLKELADDVERATTLDDVAVVCSNCHKMIHRNGGLRSLAEMKSLMQAAALRQSSSSYTK